MLGYVANVPVSVIKAGKTSVTATPAVLAASTITIQVLIKASPDNLLPVYVGPSTVTIEGGAAPGFRLDPGDSLILEVVNLAVIYLVAESAGPSVFWIAK